MPSESSAPSGSATRRRILAGLGAVATGSLAGCSGRIPGTGPAQVDAESTVEDDRIVWRYPPREGDRAGIGYAAVEAGRPIQRGDRPPALPLEFNSTVGRIAASEPHEGYRPDWFRFRIWPPETYEASVQYEVRVEPPGQWTGFAAYYDVRPTVRRFAVELRDVDTQGTIIVPAVLDPGTDPLPESLVCSFTVQASRPGAFGRTVRVGDRGTIELDAG